MKRKWVRDLMSLVFAFIILVYDNVWLEWFAIIAIVAIQWTGGYWEGVIDGMVKEQLRNDALTNISNESK